MFTVEQQLPFNNSFSLDWLFWNMVNTYFWDKEVYTKKCYDLKNHDFLENLQS